MLKGCCDLKQHQKKLEHVNIIIRDIASKNPNITPITAEDYELFEEFFAKEEKHTYGNSWIYVTQGTFGIGPENLGYKYYDGKNLCAIAIYPKIEQPNIIMLYWIRPMGENILPIIVELAEKIKREYSVCSYVKKLFPEQYEFLLQHGFRSAKEFPWHSTTHSEDDTYPELIFDREKTRKTIFEAASRSKLGSALRKTSKLARENRIGMASGNFQEHAWKIVNTYFSQYSAFAKGTNISTPFDYCNMIFRDHAALIKDVEKSIILVNAKPAGFYTLERDKKFNITNLYACVALRQTYKYLADYFFIDLFKTEPTKYINVGGSEDAGIHEFKVKYKPIEKNLMFWATNYLL